MLQFTQPWMLLGLGALALPFIIHRISRLRAQPFRFPSVRFILEAPLPRHGRRRIRDWLLLALRTAILLFLVGIFAGPLWQPAGAPAPASANAGTAFFLIDNSASMHGWDHRENLRAAITRWFRENPKWSAGAIAFDSGVRAVLPPQDSADACIEWITTREPSRTEARPQPVLPALRREANAAGATRIVVFSDFQGSNWNGIDFSPLDDFAIETVRVGGFSALNRYIASALAYPDNSGGARLLVEVGQSGGRAGPVEVRLAIGGQLQTRTVQLAPDERVQLVFSVESPEATTASVTLPDDAFAADNRRDFWVGEAPPLRILVFHLPEEGMQDEGFFVTRALEAAGTGQWLRFEPVAVSTRFLSPELLRSAAAVFIPARVAAAPDTPWDVIATYVAEGGCAVVTFDFEGARALRSLELAGVSGLSYVDVRGRQRELGQRFAIAYVQPESRLDRVFSGDARRDLLLVDLRRHLLIDGVASDAILLSSDRNEPLLFTHASGEGRFVFSTFPWDTSWSDFPLRNSFLPLVREVFVSEASTLPAIIRIAPGDSLPEGFLNPDRFDSSQPGVFRFEERPVEVVVPLSESVVEARSELPHRSLDSVSANGPTADPRDQTIDLRPWLLAALVLFFLLETGLAARALRRPGHEHQTSGVTP